MRPTAGAVGRLGQMLRALATRAPRLLGAMLAAVRDLARPATPTMAAALPGRLRPWPSLPLATAVVAGTALALLLVDVLREVALPVGPAVAVVGSDPPLSAALPLPDLVASLPEPAAGPAAPTGRRALPEIPEVPAELDDIARELQRRRAEVLELEAALALREAAVRAAETDLETQVDRLEAFKSQLEALVGEAEAEEEERLQQLVRMYESMRAKSAAAIFDRLELPVILAVAKRMREARMAAILAAMDPARARVVTSELAQERGLPRLE